MSHLNMIPCKPFLRWAGGKKWLVPFIKELIAGISINHYHEPFVGGGSVFFALEGLKKKSYISDINPDLINAYLQVRDCPDKVIDKLKSYKNTEEEYYKFRGVIPDSAIDAAARFIFLNYTSFNGLYRVNRCGKYNVPYGFRKNVFFDEKRIMDASKKLQNSNIQTGSFTINKYAIKADDLVFLDPPYAISCTHNGFINYNAELFSFDDQKKVKTFIDYIDKRGAFYILSNAYHETIREIFEFESERTRCLTVERNSLIGGREAKRGKIFEYVFTNIRER